MHSTTPMENTTIHTIFSGFLILLLFKIGTFFIQLLVNFASSRWKVWTKAKGKTPNTLKGCELQIVMDRLGVTNYHSDGEKLLEGLLVADHEFSQLFEEEPSLEEVKEAFDVFDDNKDGFIDATELQRVLCSLGLEEGSEIEDCRKMIKAFDEGDDRQIDFNEFVKFLEKGF